MPSQKIIYARGFPYGAPLVMLRGGAIRREDVKEFLREKGFRWQMSDRPSYAYENYMYKAELRPILLALRDEFGCEVVPKEGMDASYVVDLEQS